MTLANTTQPQTSDDDLVCIREAGPSAPNKSLEEVLDDLPASAQRTLCGFITKVGTETMSDFWKN